MNTERREFEIRRISESLGYGLFDIAADDFTVRIAYASPEHLRRDVKKWADADRWPLDIKWHERKTREPLGGSYNGVRF